MAAVQVKMRREKISAAVLFMITYLFFYLFFTGTVQYIQTPRLGIVGLSLIFTEVKSQLYSGPLVQVIGDGFILNVRMYPFLLGLLVASLVGFNGAVIWALYRLKALRLCLLGGVWGGLGGWVANIVCFGYVCCGWPASLAMFGIGVIASLSPYLTILAIILLTANGYVVYRKLTHFEKHVVKY